MTHDAPLVIASLRAVEILDSRGRPTLAVTVVLDDGTTARAGVPSGRPLDPARRLNCVTAIRTAMPVRASPVP